MDVVAPRVGDVERAAGGQPGVGALDPPAVPPAVLAAVDPAARDPRAEVAGPAGAAGGARSGGRVRVPLVRPPAGAAARPAARPAGVEPRRQPGPRGARGRGQPARARGAPAVDPPGARRARCAALRRIRAGRGAPPRCPDARAVQAAPRPGEPVGLPEPSAPPAMARVPEPGRLPRVPPSPAGTPAAAAQLARQVRPRDAGLQPADAPGQSGPIRHPRTAALRLGPRGRQQRRDRFPPRVADHWRAQAGQASSRSRPRFCKAHLADCDAHPPADRRSGSGGWRRSERL